MKEVDSWSDNRSSSVERKAAEDRSYPARFRHSTPCSRNSAAQGSRRSLRDPKGGLKPPTGWAQAATESCEVIADFRLTLERDYVSMLTVRRPARRSPVHTDEVEFVQELLGHSTIAVTLDTYSHVLPGMDDGLADTMDKALG